jgi:glycosyltransferase involved in cell wall biosynthesis
MTGHPSSTESASLARIDCLHVIASLDPATGGTAEGVQQLASSALRGGRTVEILTLDLPHNTWGDSVGCTVHRLGPCTLGTYRYSALLRPWLRAHHGQYKSVVVHGLWQYHGLAVRSELHATATPYFVYTHGMLDPWFKHEFPLKHLKKSLYWRWGEYRVLRDARAVLFTCEEERRLARQSFAHYRANEAVVSFGSPGPGDADATAQREAFLQQFPQLRDKRVLLFLGRVHLKKACDLLVSAFAAVVHTDPQLQLVIAGPDHDGLEPQMRALATGLGSDRITFTGMLNEQLKWGALRAAEVLLLPSHQENFGISVVEALACAVPVLISDKVNIWREIVADDAGMAEADTPDGTTKLLRRWLALDTEARLQMKLQAAGCYQRHFHMSAAAQRLVDTIAPHLCGAKAPAAN